MLQRSNKVALTGEVSGVGITARRLEVMLMCTESNDHVVA